MSEEANYDKAKRLAWGDYVDTPQAAQIFATLAIADAVRELTRQLSASASFEVKL